MPESPEGAASVACPKHGVPYINESGGPTMPTPLGRTYCPRCQEDLNTALDAQPRVWGDPPNVDRCTFCAHPHAKCEKWVEQTEKPCCVNCSHGQATVRSDDDE